MAERPRSLGLQLFTLALPAQQRTYEKETFYTYGLVKDAETLQPISAVHIFNGKFGNYTDQEGAFTIQTGPQDTIIFSHVSYERYFLSAQAMIADTVFIFLQQKTNMLPGVNVFALPGEEKLRSEILQLQIAPSIEEVYAKNNIGYAHKLYLMEVVPEMNSEDNYKYYFNSHRDVSLFSSNPSKGLVKAIRNVRRPSQGIRMNQPACYIYFSLYLNKDRAQPSPDSIVAVSATPDSIPADTVMKQRYQP